MFRGKLLLSILIAFSDYTCADPDADGGRVPPSGTFLWRRRKSICISRIPRSLGSLVTSSDGSIVGSTMLSISSAHSPDIAFYSPDNVFYRGLGQEASSILLHRSATSRIAPTVDVCMCDEEDCHTSDSLTRLRVQREASYARATAARSSLMTPSEDDVTQNWGEPSDSITRLQLVRQRGVIASERTAPEVVTFRRRRSRAVDPAHAKVDLCMTT